MDAQKTLQEKCLTNWRGMVTKTGDCITSNYDKQPSPNEINSSACSIRKAAN